ncbi:MAG TPA: hypothetical protein VFX61_12760 [Micromonosporaceae bacterium]|nr:hypothetical protein [Micromonosporaceae bacterium]
MLVIPLAIVGPAGAASDQLAVDEISHSKNIELVANVPRHGPFAGPNVYHSDMAFWGNYLFQGSYGGITIYDITHPQRPQIVTQIDCNGAQGDVTVSPDGKLLFMSVDSPRSDDTCTSSSGSAADPEAWEGIRIFDITDKANPVYVKAVRTDCGSHTHTLVPGNDDTLYLYVSSYGPNVRFPHCQPPHDSISIVEVPLGNPAAASVVAKPLLFPDLTGATSTSGCHDITVFPAGSLAAGACMGDGILLDISDPLNPRKITGVRDPNFAFWHSATLINGGKGVIFTDELGGGGAPTCNEAIGPRRGADAIYDIVGDGDDRQLVFRSYFKIPRMQQSTENCVAHNGMLLPIKGRDVYVQAWYQGGVSVFDFTDRSKDPQEIAFFERGPLSTTSLILGGSWSAYWYNGYIYSSDIQKGLDVLKITGLEGVSSANFNKLPYLNPQTQDNYKDTGNRS